MSASSAAGGGVKRDVSVFLEKLDTYEPTLPTEVVSYYLKRSGCDTVDKRIPKLVALAADKFLAEMIYEAKQTTLLKSKSGKVKNKRQIEEMNSTLTMEAVCANLKRKRIDVNPKRLRPTLILKNSGDIPEPESKK